jgi:CBS domain-containing protein
MSHVTQLSRSLKGIVWSADLESAAQFMTEENIGALGVYSSDGHDLLGVITDRDITLAVSKGLDPTSTSVGQMMSGTPLGSVDPITSEEAWDLMDSGRVRYLIVRDNGSDLIVSIGGV